MSIFTDAIIGGPYVIFDPTNPTGTQTTVVYTNAYGTGAIQNGNSDRLSSIAFAKGRIGTNYNNQSGQEGLLFAGQIAQWAAVEGRLSGEERMKRIRYVSNRYNLGIPY